MAKKKTVKSSIKPKSKVVKPKVIKVTIQKYFQLRDPPIHKYSRAYLSEQFRGIMKSRDEWDIELKKYFTKGG